MTEPEGAEVKVRCLPSCCLSFETLPLTELEPPDSVRLLVSKP